MPYCRIFCGMLEKNQTCRLCGEIKPLCNSHIVPELAYQPIKNEKNQIFVAGRKNRVVQKGYTEKLLCSQCEMLLSCYENVFKKAWMNTILPDFRRLPTRPLNDVVSVDIDDFDSFKLFHLSVFWRAAVSSGFKAPGISLGPYERKIADLIMGQSSGKIGDFPFWGCLNLDNEKRPVPTVTQLAEGTGRFESHRYYMMSYAFCDWIFVTAQPGPRWLTDMEQKCRDEKLFLLLTVPHTQSKSFLLEADWLRKLRQ